MMDEDSRMHRCLVGTVKMLASSAALQSQYLSEASKRARYSVLADDISTEFCCWHECASELARKGLLTKTSLGHVGILRTVIEAIPAEPQYWIAEALVSSPIWATVRDQAGAALASMEYS